GVTTVKGLRLYVELMFRYMIGIVTIAAAVAFVWGGFRYIIGSSLGDISSAKTIMVDALIGLILSFGAITLLNTLNPATTRYDRLTVYLINKNEFSALEYCKDYKPTPGKAVKYADAGIPPGSVLFDTAKFDVEVKQTICGKEYYIQSFAGRMCKGLEC